MGKIIINRKNNFRQKIRIFTVFIDGREMGVVRNGVAEEFAVTPGSHKVRCKASWFYSTDYEVFVGEGQVKFLQVEADLPFFWPMYILLIGGLTLPFLYRMITGERDMPDNLQWLRAIVMIVVALYFIFFVVIRRKSYLRITEDTRNIFNS